MDWDPIVGVPIRDTADHVTGFILRPYGPDLFSALMDDGSVRYYLRGSDRFKTNFPPRPTSD